ncbi:MAG: hypothetical protein EXR79_15320 [Myxococcales bacterium]|nr:hypothetical protein [Myxococcales bacterium]
MRPALGWHGLVVGQRGARPGRQRREHTCGVAPNGSVACFGNNADGQLTGQPGLPTKTIAPQKVAGTEPN